MTKTEVKSKEVIDEVKEESSEESSLYYFYSVGCGWCKKADPVVDELIADGHNILKLDLANGDNSKLQQELKTKYNAQCGTPWFIDGETGNQVCGFRDKATLEKWVNGEEIPEPPRPNGTPPRVPFHNASKKEVSGWKKEYQKWADDNQHLPNILTSDKILERPRPKSDPPPRPQPSWTDDQFDDWVKDWDKWAKENNHLPNLQSGEQMIQSFKGRLNSQGNPPTGAPGQAISPDMNKRLSELETKMDRIIRHLGVK